MAFTLNNDQQLDLVCALADNSDLVEGLLEDYIANLGNEELEEVYGLYF